jgi:predicted RNA binding protein YcfA (HicA-like mRNA interferase family)
MTKLPSSEKVLQVLLSQGFLLKSQKGSHQKLSNGERTVIVPAGRKEIPVGTLKSISRQAGIDYENFINL